MNTTQIAAIERTIGRCTKQFQQSMLGLVLMSLSPLGALAQTEHTHAAATPQTAAQKSQASALVKIVRDSTERFKDVAQAEKEGYALQFGCVSGPDSGAMGLHYVNGALVNAGVVDATHPPIVIYEAQPNGHLKLIGADFLVIADAWDKKTRVRRSSWDSCSTIGRVPIASGSRPSTRCMSGLGRRTPTARS